MEKTGGDDLRMEVMVMKWIHLLVMIRPGEWLCDRVTEEFGS